jgi:hypothetical protein
MNRTSQWLGAVVVCIALYSNQQALACAKAWSGGQGKGRSEAKRPTKPKSQQQHEARKQLLDLMRDPLRYEGNTVSFNAGWVLSEQANSYQRALTPPNVRKGPDWIEIPIDFSLASIIASDAMAKLSRAERNRIRSYGTLQIDRSEYYDVFFGPEKDQLTFAIDTELYARDPLAPMRVLKIYKKELSQLNHQRRKAAVHRLPLVAIQSVPWQELVQGFADLSRLEGKAGDVTVKQWTKIPNDLHRWLATKELTERGSVSMSDEEIGHIRTVLAVGLLRLDLLVPNKGTERSVPRVTMVSGPYAAERMFLDLARVRGGDPTKELRYMNGLISDNAHVFFGVEMDTVAKSLLPLGALDKDNEILILEDQLVDVDGKHAEDIIDELKLDRRSLDMIQGYLNPPFEVKKMLRLTQGVFASNQYVGFFIENGGRTFLVLDTPIAGNAVYIFVMEKNAEGAWFASYPSKKQVRNGVDAFIARIFHKQNTTPYDRVMERIRSYDPESF